MDCKKEIGVGEKYHRLFGMAEEGDHPYEVISCDICFDPVTKMVRY